MTGESDSPQGEGLYERLIADLDAAGATYRLLDHPAGQPLP